MNFSLYITPIDSDANNVELSLRSQKNTLKRTTSTSRIYLSFTDAMSVRESKDGKISLIANKHDDASETLYNIIESESYEQMEDLFWAVVIDTNNDVVRVINDRFSSKEIYYLQINEAILFFTDYKISFSFVEKPIKINVSALKMYLIDGYISSPYTIIDGVNKLPYSSCATIRHNCVSIQQYFSFRKDLSRKRDTELCYNDAKFRFEKFVMQSIIRKMTSDKATVLLSSGVDSAYLTVASKKIYNYVDALTIGQNVGDDRYDEARDAKIVADMLGVQQTIKTLNPDLIFDSIKYSIEIFPELFGDTAQIAVYLMACNGDASKDYICGEGADSLFFTGSGNEYKRNKKELFVNKMFSAPVDNEHRPIQFDEYSYEWECVLQGLVHKTTAVFEHFNLNVIFPYLDNSLIEFCMSLPECYLEHDKKKKRVLRDLLNEKINYDALQLPKRGAGVPVYKILKENHKNELARLLARELIARQGIFNVEVIAEMLNCFLNDCKYNDVKVSGLIWRLYLFQKWYERYIN